ncbi:unnamed protein product [Lactuca virosa]|uniref:CUE domain-containing protein n=1 Tax=Lactuca virosa TaxID=75947 RepID=A0AAU9LSY5_9ASTR|nr:unnamed protein product [Lactuca virosa]
MGFNSVYKALQDVFPQVDSRLLRAVAIEHPKDADLAVEVVLVDIIPHLSEQSQSPPVNFSNKVENTPSLFEDGGKTVQLEAAMGSEQSFKAGSSSTDANGEAANVGNGLPILLEKGGDKSNVDERDLYDNRDEESFGIFGKNVALLVETFENDSKVTGYIQKEAGSRFSSSPEPHLAVTQELDPGSSSKTPSENNDFVTEENTEGESMMNSSLTRSDQICSTELLEDILEEARNEKKTLVSTMDSVVELMREVEEKEKTAEEAKEEATRDCSHIFAKVDELKQALGRAKEANDMHAGEVNAEKAILATELKELQLRLLTLSDERNYSLRILNEMREALEIRLSVALKEIEAAEGQKLEKEKFAREALAYQESQLEKVVEESQKLQREAEENSKLQEFLMDRGRAIDILQGEISVKCQDVRLLKEKFDKRIPLSRSLSSSQTSSVLAAASPSSSFTTTTRVVVAEPEAEMYETPKKRLELDDPYSPKSLPSPPTQTVFHFGAAEKQTSSNDAWKLLLNDDDWELFDKGELSTGAA